MLRRILPLVIVLLGLLPGTALAGGGDYVFDGGTARQQESVRDALDASAFDWSLVPQRITVHIGAFGTSHSTPGHVWLDARLLDAGSFAWATVMDEYAHQVDFLVLDAERRAVLAERLGGDGWCYEANETTHGRAGCERFASMVAWAYWPSAQNAYRGTAEAAAMPAAEFRALLADLIGAPRALSASRAVSAFKPRSKGKPRR
jgi:hypothetical protein